MLPFRHILVPVDFGDPSTRAIDLALTIAMRFEAKVTLLHVTWMPPYYYAAYAEGLAVPIDDIENEAKVMLEDALVKAQSRYPRTESKIVAGRPWEGILDAITATGADLVVMGTHGRRGAERAFLGSVAEKTVRHSPIPVLTTPARERSS